MTNWLDEGFGCNDAALSPVGAALASDPGISDARMRVITGPAHLLMIDATIKQVAFQGGTLYSAGEAMLFIIRLNSSVTNQSPPPYQSSLGIMKQLGTLVYGRMFCPGNQVPIHFKPGSMACRDGEKLLVGCTGVRLSNNVNDASDIQLNVYGRYLNDLPIPLRPR